MTTCPYQYLFIYEIAGEITLGPPLDLKNYLGCWREGECSYLFFTCKMDLALKAFIGEDQSERYLSETVINYEDWEAGYPLKPRSIAGFYLCPTWEPCETPPGEHLIWIDPGVAFGSGYHPTTKMCLELINEVYKREYLPRVLDLGTGTGILALACVARGAAQVLAVDHNNLAIGTAIKNVQYNRQEHCITLICDDVLKYCGTPADLALANIYYGAVRDLLDQDSFLDKKWYILSGLMGTEVDKVLTQMKTMPLEPEIILDDNFWFAVLARHL
ncbi:MAG: hypothetical protein BZ151_12390 [Desulfobacca sp. 4484_104]|nr:MAG: hypothetical protein BZ151_12390 [Desulfobacca sp. 4484_104]RLA89326.1 MAG: hypothetical protein DRG58_05370 [Deltaproteobacteria bacterium]